MSVVTLAFPESLQEFFPPEVSVEATSIMDACQLLFAQFTLPNGQSKLPLRLKQCPNFELMEVPLTRSVRVDVEDLRHGYSGAGGGGQKNDGAKLLAIGTAVVLFAMGFGTAGAKLTSFTIKLGLAIALNGLIAILSPTPKDEETQPDKKSRYFSGEKMTTAMGTPIPIVLGTHRVYGHLLSFNIDSRNFDGIDQPETSPFFTAKVNEALPTGQKLRRFYGYIQAGSQVKLLQTDNAVHRTGEAL